MAKSAPERRFPVPRGRWGFVEYAITSTGKYRAEVFINKTIIQDFGKKNGEKARRKIIAIFQYVSDYGDSPKLEHKRGDIYGIKLEFLNKPIRFGCFQNGKCWVLTHGFYKPGAKKGLGPWPARELDQADQIKKEHLAQFRNPS